MPLFADLPVEEDETLSAPDLARLLGLPQPPPYRAAAEPAMSQLLGAVPEQPPYRAPIDQTPDLAMPEEINGPIDFASPTPPPYRAKVRRHIPARPPVTVPAPVLPVAHPPVPEMQPVDIFTGKPQQNTAPTMGMAGVPLPAPPPSMQIDPEKIYRASKQNIKSFIGATGPMVRGNPELGGSLGGAPPTTESDPKTWTNSEIDQFGEAVKKPLIPLSAGAQPGSVMENALRAGESISSPAGIATVAGLYASGGALAATGLTGVPYTLAKLALNAGMTAPMAIDAGKSLYHAGVAVAKGDQHEAARQMAGGSVQAMFAILGLRAGFRDLGDFSDALDAHNAVAEKLFQDQVKRGSTVQAARVTATQHMGDPIPVKVRQGPPGPDGQTPLTDATIQLSDVSVSGSTLGRPAYQVIDDATGKPLFSGFANEVKTWLASNKAQPGTPVDLGPPAEAAPPRGPRPLMQEFGAGTEPTPGAPEHPLTPDELITLQRDPATISNPRKRAQLEQRQQEIANRAQMATNALAGHVDPFAGFEEELKQSTAGSSPAEPPQAPPPEPPPPAKVEKPSEATPNAPTAALPTVPETPETIAAQMEQLAAGKRKAVMIPNGTQAPAAFPDGVPISVTSDGLGNTYAYRRDLTTEGEVKSAAKGDKLNELLGSAQGGLGAPEKKALDLSPGEKFAVVVRAADGTEVQSTATDEEHLSATLAAHERLVPPGGTVHVEPAEKVLAERTGAEPGTNPDWSVRERDQDASDRKPEALGTPAEIGGRDNFSQEELEQIYAEHVGLGGHVDPTPNSAGNAAPARPTKTAGPDGIPFAPYLDLSKAPPGALEQPEATLEDAKAARDKYRQETIASARAHLKQHPDTPPENLAAQFSLGKNQVAEIYREAQGEAEPKLIGYARTDSLRGTDLKRAIQPEPGPYTFPVYEVPVDQLVSRDETIKGYIKDRQPDIDRYADMIRQDGGASLPPLVAAKREDGKYLVDNGTRRMMAARQAGLATVPVAVSNAEPAEPKNFHREAPREERRKFPRETMLAQPEHPTRAEEDRQLEKDINDRNVETTPRKANQGRSIEERFNELRDKAETGAREEARLGRIAEDTTQPERNREIAREGATAAREQLKEAFRELGDDYGTATYILRQRLGEQYGLTGQFARRRLEAPITYFTGAAAHYDDVQKAARERNDLGLVITPKTAHYANLHGHYPQIMVDNGVFSKEGFKEDAFRRLLDRIDTPELKKKIQFVVAPDVMVHDEETGDVRGDAEATLEQFEQWADELHARDFPVAFVAQPGIEHMLDQVPWDKVDTLFIGGHKPWKFGDEKETGGPGSPGAKAWIQIFSEAHKRRIPIHVGRAYRAKDIEHVHANLGVRSVDSTHIGYEPSKALPFILRQLDRWNGHGRLPKYYDEGDMIRAEEELERQINSGETESPASKDDIEAPAEIGGASYADRIRQAKDLDTAGEIYGEMEDEINALMESAGMRPLVGFRVAEGMEGISDVKNSHQSFQTVTEKQWEKATAQLAGKDPQKADQLTKLVAQGREADQAFRALEADDKEAWLQGHSERAAENASKKDDLEKPAEIETKSEGTPVKAESPVTWLNDDFGNFSLPDGTKLVSKSGRPLAPSPKFDAETSRKRKLSLTRQRTWLVDEARKEAAAKGDRFMQTLLKGADPNNYPRATADMVNEYLFGDPTGPVESSFAQNTAEPVKQAPKSRPAPKPKADLEAPAEMADGPFDPVRALVEDAAKGDPEDDRFPPLKILDAREVHAQKVEVGWDPHQNRETHVIAGKTEDGQPVVGYVIERDGAIHPDLLPEWFVGEKNIRADAKGRGMWDDWLPEVINRALAKSEKIEAHDRGEGAAGSRNEPVRDERPESLEGVQADDVRGSGEAEDALSGGVGSGDENAGAPAGTPIRAGEDELRPGEGDGVQGVVSTPGRTGTTRPDVQSSPVTTSLANDFRLTPEQAAEIENGGSRTKARNNIEAIRTIKQIIEEGGRPPTLEEQHKIAKYVGWGDSEMAQGIFKNRSEWRGIREDLKSLLTDEEMDAAEESTLNAHYTRRDVAAAMWDALVRMGFRAGGSVLEPGMGIGNFFMMMPEELLPGTTRTGVEMDLLTGAMANALYPGSNIVVKPYQHTNLPDGYFDAAIGNVPFAKIQINDPVFKRQPYLTQNVHNYFFAKSIQKLRPGGVMLAITSRFTMDGTTGKAFREWMSKEAELLGAIRLPRDTFKANAGTSVTVDIIALRKRVPDGIPASSETWIDAPEMTTSDGIKVNINEYFHRHPDMMLGEMQGGTQYARGYPELFGKFSMDALKEALAKLPADVIPAWASQTGARDNQVENYPEASHIKNQQFGIVNGAVVQREGAYFRPVTLKGKKLERMKGMIELRGAAREVVRTQTMGLSEPEILDARKDLNKVYDAFVAKHGPVNGMGNALIFADDPDWGMLSGLLEDYDKSAYIAVPKEAKGGGKWEVKGNDVSLVHGKTRYRIAGKRPIFRERTNEKPARIEKVDTGAEALAVSLNELGRMDWDRMQELTGSDPEDLQKELAGKIFRHPVSRQWETADEYLSGNVRQKLKDAQFAAERHPEFEPNVEALKAVQPPDKEAGKIKVSLGATWVPDADYADFAKEILKAEARPEPGAERGTTRPIVSYVVQTGGFGVNASYQFSDDGVANQTEYGNAYFTGMALFEMALNGRTPVARDTEYDMDGNEREVKNPDATIESVEKQQRLNDKFTEWIWSDVDRAKRLALKFNEERNNLRLREFDGSHLTFPGLNKTWLRNGEPDPHQKNVVWRTIQSGNTLYAHVVGSGKTLEMIMAAMELKRLGLRKKSSVVVPNHLVGQWRDDWMRAYPAAQILVPTKKDFEKVNRQRLMARIASGNYDAVIMGHNSFEKLSVRDDTFNEFVDSQLKEINDALDVARSGLSKKDEFKDPTIKQLRRRKAQLEAKLEKRSKRDEKDTGLNFEDLGIDQIFVDEADLFKNLGYMTMMDRIAGLPNTDSNRATDMLLKTQYVGKLHGGDRGVVFATGTPVSNSIAEIWTMMRYLMPTYLEREGMDQFDAWAKTFGKTRTQMEVAPEGGRFIQRTRFAKFQNAGQMMGMFRLVADIKVAKQLNLPTPAIYKGGYVDVVAKATDELKAFVEHIGERADAIRSGQVKPEEDNMLLISSDGRKASLDMRLVNPRAKEDPDSKVNKAVKNILDIYKEFGEYKATQLVFLDLSTPKSEKVRKKKAPASDEVANTDPEAESADLYGEKDEEEETEVETGEEARERFTVYANIKRKLIEGGLKPEEVAFIQDAKNDAQKLALFSKVNAGEVRVLLGSTEGMGAGTNVQQRLVALHHLDAPWRPRDMAQRDGRIVRQGNQLYDKHKIPVRLYRYMTEGSFDAFMWETLAAKAGPIEQLMEGDPNMDEVEEMSPFVMSFEQAKAASTGNPLIREKIILDQDVHKLSIMRGSWLNEQATVARQLVEVPPQIKRYEDGIRDFEADIKTRDANADLVVDGKSYTGKETRAEGAPALIKVLEKLGPIAELTPINASYRGFKLAATPQSESLGYRAKKKGDFNKPGDYYAREKQPDGKYLYYRSSSKYMGGSYVHSREAYELKPVPKEKAEQLHADWDDLAKDSKKWADYGIFRFHTSPNLRLEAKSGNSAIIANYSSPAGTIQSADFHLQFEESLREAKNQLQRLEKKLTELESKRGEPFQQEEKLQTMLRRQSELAMQLGEGGDDLQALRAAEDGDEGSSSRNPLTPFLKDPRASMHAKWFPQKRYFGATGGRAKNTIKGHRITPELGVHEGPALTKGGARPWVVDHIPSGMEIRQFRNDHEAVAYARQAGKALDWNWGAPPEDFRAKLQAFKYRPPSETPEQSRERLKDLGELKASDQFYVTRGEGETDADNSPLTTRAEGEGVYLGFGFGALQPALDVAGKAAKDYTLQIAVPKLAALWHGTRETAEGLAHLLSPVSGVDSETVKSIFEMKGGREAAQHLLRAKMKKWSKRVDQMTQAEMVDFIDRQKTGQRQADRELNTLARFMRKVDDALFREIEKYHPSVSYLENHYRVLWKVIPGSPQARGGFKGSFKRPIRGSRGMLKQAKLVDMSEGLRLGGVPHTYNPIKNFELAYQDSMKFITAQRMWEDFAVKGVRKFVRKGRREPAGYVKLKDAIAKVYFPVNQGLVDAGDWYVEQGAARMLNNYLGEDHIRRHAAGRFLMWMKNASTAIELSISPFHAIFEGNEAVGSQIGQALREMWNLGVLNRDVKAVGRGLKTLATSPAAFYTVAHEGHMAKQAFEDWPSFSRSAAGQEWLKKYPQARQDLKDFFDAGGIMGQHEDFKTGAVASFKEYMRSASAQDPKNYIAAAFKSIPALNQSLMKPLFEKYIPNLKLGFFMREYALAKREYADRIASGEVTLDQLARSIIRSIDNRFGEMNYDNLFWDRTFKTANQLMFRSVTWKLGNVRANADAVTGALKELSRTLHGGGPPKLDMNTSWLLGMTFWTAILGSVITFLATGKRPKEMKDFVYPVIDEANHIRVSLPTYWRDLLHLAHSPVGYVKSSLSGEIGRIADIWQNKDFYGNEVYSEDEPFYNKAWDAAKHMVPLPFSVSSGRQAKQEGGSAIARSAGYLGFTKAPRYIEQSDAEQLASDFLNQHREIGSRTRAQSDRSQARAAIRNIYRHGGDARKEEQAAEAKGYMKPSDVPKLRMEATRGELARMVHSLSGRPESLSELLKVYDAATPEERKSIEPEVRKKVMASRLKPYLWNEKSEALASKYFHVRPYHPKAPAADLGTPASLEGTA